MNKYVSLLALGLLGCASPQKAGMSQNKAVPVVQIADDGFSLPTIREARISNPEGSLRTVAEKLYEKIKKKSRENPKTFGQIDYIDASGYRFTVSAHVCSPDLCSYLNILLVAKDSDRLFFLASEKYPFGSLDGASSHAGELPLDDPVVKETYEFLLRKSYQHIDKASLGSWKLEAKINDAEIPKASKKIFDYINLRD